MSEITVQIGEKETEIDFEREAVVRDPLGREGFILFLCFTADHNPFDPREAGSQIYSFNRRDPNPYPVGQPIPAAEELRRRIREEHGPYVRFLGRFEHGRVLWHQEGRIPFGTEGDYRWDGQRFGGVWIPSDELVQYAEKQEDTEEFLAGACEGFLKEWNAFINGELYVAMWDVYPLLYTQSDEPKLSPASYREEQPIDFRSMGSLYRDDIAEYFEEQTDVIGRSIDSFKEKHNGNVS